MRRENVGYQGDLTAYVDTHTALSSKLSGAVCMLIGRRTPGGRTKARERAIDIAKAMLSQTKKFPVETGSRTKVK